MTWERKGSLSRAKQVEGKIGQHVDDETRVSQRRGSQTEGGRRTEPAPSTASMERETMECQAATDGGRAVEAG